MLFVIYICKSGSFPPSFGGFDMEKGDPVSQKHGIIFVVDSADKGRASLARDELTSTVNHEGKRTTSLSFSVLKQEMSSTYYRQQV